MDRAAEAVRGAAAQGARLAVLPELYTSGYVMTGREEAADLAEEIPSGPSTRRLADLAAETGTVLVMGLPERAGDKVYNACVAVGPSGFLGRYRKIHLFFKETLWFDPGREPPPVIDAGDAKIGLMICWDWIVPEVARRLALSGAQVLCHPSNLVLAFCQDAMVTRCLENRVFALTCNRIGGEARGGLDLKFTGRSQITGVMGTVHARGSAGEEEILIAEIRPEDALDKTATEHNHLFEQRVPGLYGL
jgi:predicted amidohydrolase